MFYSIILVVATILPFATLMSGLIYLFGVLLLDAWFMYLAVRLYREPTDQLAIQQFRYSIWYLMALFLLLFVDRYWYWLMAKI